MLGSIAQGLTLRAELLGSIQSGASSDLAGMADHWGGPRAIEVLTAAADYAESMAPATGALQAAAEVVSGWSTAAMEASELIATWERARSGAIPAGAPPNR